MSSLVCVGVIAGAHGIKGEVKVKSFTEDVMKIVHYGPLFDESGARRFDMTVRAKAKDGLIAVIDGVGDRNAAEALRGTKLYVPRSALPQTEPEEFYHADLIGLAAELADGTKLGEVVAVHNFGAGDLIEIRRANGRTLDLPFTQAVVPVVDVEGRRIEVDLPHGLEEGPEGPEKTRKTGGWPGGGRRGKHG